MQVLRDRHPADPAQDMAFSEQLLRDVAAGVRAPAARLYRPGATVAFGRRDAHLAGFAAAQDAARDHGFTPLVRLGGGHAAAYDAGSVVVELVTPQPHIGHGIDERFTALATLLTDALEAGGITATVGELPGEYCPGRWSIHAQGSTVKLAGLAQRSVRGAALTTAFLAVEHGDAIRAVLTDVYAQLGLDWDPATAGAAEDVRPGLTVQAAEAALVQALSARGTRGAASP